MKKKILIVEDEVSLMNAIALKLKSEEFEVLKAKNGQEGLELAINKKPDLILLDIVMPVMDGITMLEKLRLDERGKKIPVIVLTNLSSNTEVSASIKKKVREYLVKTDWKLEEIMEKIKKILA